MKRSYLFLLALLFVGSGLTGCMVSGGLIIEHEPVIAGHVPPYTIEKRNHYRFQHRKKSSVVRVPPGHKPPKGMCRIWFDNRPPGHQPPPGNCRVLRRQVPYNAILIRG